MADPALLVVDDDVAPRDLLAEVLSEALTAEWMGSVTKLNDTAKPHPDEHVLVDASVTRAC